MTTLVVLFNLKDPDDKGAYEAWARSTDLPTVRALASVERFRTLRTSGIFSSDHPAPYQYIEIIDLGDTAQFEKDVSSEVMQELARDFQSFADDPLFITTESID